MRFYTTDWNAKRHTKRLKKVLRRYGHDVSYTSCLDFMARLYGFANFAELKRTTADQPLSAFDNDVDDDILEIRFGRGALRRHSRRRARRDQPDQPPQRPSYRVQRRRARRDKAPE